MGEWRDIASAPKDGTPILVCDILGSMTTVEWFEHRPGAKGWWTLVEPGLHAEDSEFYNATHWMPLPEPPALSTGAKG